MIVNNDLDNTKVKQRGKKEIDKSK